MVKGWSRRASGRISPFSFSSLWGQHTPQPWRRGQKKPSSVCRSLPGIHFIVSVTKSWQRKTIKTGDRVFSDEKTKKEMEEKHGTFFGRVLPAAPLPPRSLLWILPLYPDHKSHTLPGKAERRLDWNIHWNFWGLYGNAQSFSSSIQIWMLLHTNQG